MKKILMTLGIVFVLSMFFYSVPVKARRIICNSDNDDATYYCEEATPAELISIRAGYVPGTQIDTYFYCTSMPIPLMGHNTAVGEIFSCKDDMFCNNIVQDLINQGTDPLEVIVNYLKNNNIEVFWSLRMNDVHDGHPTDYAQYVMPQLKKDHPEYLVGSEQSPPLYGRWTALDYSHSAVRQLVYDLIEEVCQNYDVDGIELDFFRDPIFFKSVADGGSASQAELNLMTDLVSDIKDLADTYNISLAVRIPDSVEYCEGIGLDIEEWLGQGLVDLLITGDHFQLNDFDYVVALAHTYNVPVYPCLSPSSISAEENRNSIESYRARAMNAWNAGADGVYTFNYPYPWAAMYQEIGDSDSLQELDKVYFCSPLGTYILDDFLADGMQYWNRSLLSPIDKRVLYLNTPLVLDCSIGDDLYWGINENIYPEVKCLLKHDGNISNIENKITVKLNGDDLGRGVAIDGGLEYSVNPAYVIQGHNNFEIELLPAWSASYNAQEGELPQGPFWKSHISTGSTSEIVNDYLHLVDPGSGYAFYQYNWNINPNDAFNIDIDMKLVSSGGYTCAVAVYFANGANEEVLTFHADRIQTLYSNLSYYMNTTDDFHNYKLEVENNDIKIYVDGVLRIDGSGEFDHSSTTNNLWFGSGSGAGVGESCWKYMRFSTSPTWTDSYDAQAGELPQNTPWVGYISQGSTSEIVNDYLHLIDPGSGYASYQYNWNMNPYDNFVVDASMKLVSSGGYTSAVSIYVGNGANDEILNFYTDKIQTLYSGLSYNMDTTDGFHNYRIDVKNNDIKIYVDGVLRIDGSGEFDHSSTTNNLWFGSGSSPGTGESCWKYVRFSTSPVWTDSYNAQDGELPQNPPWKSSVSSISTAEVVNDYLRLVDPGSGYACYQYNWMVNPSDNLIIDTGMKLISSGGYTSAVSIYVGNGANDEILNFYTDKIQTLYSGLSYNMDTTNGFHNYRIDLRNNDIKIYVDGVLRIDGSGEFDHSSTTNNFWFGSGSSTGTGESHWKYIRISKNNIILNDLITTVNYIQE